MKTKYAMAAAFVLASATAASADQLAYTFATADGTPYCDGLVMDVTDTFASGQHVGSGCANPVAGDLAGGLEVRGLGSRHLKWTVSTSDKANVPHTIEVYIVDPSLMTWQVYEEDTVDGVPFQLVDSGMLLNGAPPAHGGVLRPVSGARK